MKQSNNSSSRPCFDFSNSCHLICVHSIRSPNGNGSKRCIYAKELASIS